MYKKKKKRDARAMLLFYQSKPYCFLPFSMTSPLSLLKLPNELAISTGPEIAVEIQPMESPSFDSKTGNPLLAWDTLARVTVLLDYWQSNGLTYLVTTLQRHTLH